jgi:hypothetical protein
MLYYRIGIILTFWKPIIIPSTYKNRVLHHGTAGLFFQIKGG